MIRVFSKMSIRLKAILAVLLVGLLTSGYFVVSFSSFFETEALRAMADKSQVVSEMSASQLGTVLGSKDERGVDPIISTLSHLPDVQYIVIRRGAVNMQSSFNADEAEALSFMDLNEKRSGAIVYKTMGPVVENGRGGA